MTDTKLKDTGTGTAWPSLTLNSLADAGSAEGAALNLGDPRPTTVGLKLKFKGSSASNANFIDVFMLWSPDNTDFTDANNGRWVRSTRMNGATAGVDVFNVPSEARYVKPRLTNRSGAALDSTGNELQYWTVHPNTV